MGDNAVEEEDIDELGVGGAVVRGAAKLSGPDLAVTEERDDPATVAEVAESETEELHAVLTAISVATPKIDRRRAPENKPLSSG